MAPPALAPAGWLPLVTTLRVVVLTWNRPDSLGRLLASLEAATYSWPGAPPWQLLLEIRIDGEGGEQGEEVKQMARQFNFSHGLKTVVESEANRGIMEAWRHAWAWRERELFVVIEDDAEMSPQWYRALTNSWLRYGGLAELAGVGLQKQTFTALGKHDVDVGARAGDQPVFLYQLPSSIGTSPHPWHWARMMELYGARLADCPPGMSCVKSVWESWWLQYCMDQHLFTLYFNTQFALAVDHREAGYHHQGGLGRHSDRVEAWESRWERWALPRQPLRLDLYLQPVSELQLAAQQLALVHGRLTVVVATAANWARVAGQLEELGRESLAGVLLVLPAPLQDLPFPPRVGGLYRAAAGGPRVVVEAPVGLNSSLAATPEAAFDHQWHVLLQLTQQANRLVTLPDLAAIATPLPANLTSCLGAGRRRGQASPALDWLATDGSFAAFTFFVGLRDWRVKGAGGWRLRDYLVRLGDPRHAQPPVSWSWAAADLRAEPYY